MIGNFLNGISYILLLNSLVKLSNDWFSSSERFIMTSFSSMFNFFGLAIGFYMPNIWVDPTDSKERIKEQI